MDRWQQIQQLFDGALQRPTEEHQAYLEQACGQDHKLRREVESLLAAHEESDSFMAEPALAGMAEVLGNSTDTLNAGDMLGAYQVLALIGRGGMGEVYQARDTRLKRNVAIKTMPRAVAADPERLRRFDQEARAAAALNHPNILSVYDMGVNDGSPYIVSELLEGQTLRELLRQGPIPPRDALNYAIQAAHGLAAAHDAGIVHRDLKPENLFITKDARLKILDFGIAKLTRPNDEAENDASPQTETGRVFGTLGYMSPEQVRGQPADHRSDVFSFGAILYEMFSGKKAFAGDSSADKISAILHHDPSQLARIAPRVHPAVDRVVRCALEKNPLQRFQSVHDLAFQLEEAATSPLTQWGWLIRRRFAKSSTSGLRILALAAGVIVAIGLASALYLYFHSQKSHRLTDEDTIVLADFSNETGDAVFDDTLKQGLSISLAQSPFLNLLADSKVTATLKMMGHSPEERLTRDLAHEVCVRTASKAMLAGSIAGLGRQYVIGLTAVKCDTGDVLAREQVQAAAKEHVLKALDEAAKHMRAQLGEALATVQKYDSPLEQATTPSLEALQAYSKGIRISSRDDAAALPLFKRAIALDPTFAVAYSALGGSYGNLGEDGVAKENFKRAYELSEHTSDRERYTILGNYFSGVTGEMEKAIRVYEEWSQAYPRSQKARGNLGLLHFWLGQYEEAAADETEAIRLNPDSPIAYGNLMLIHLASNHFEEAKSTYTQALARKQEHVFLHLNRYMVAFLEGDVAEMERQVAWASGRPEAEDLLLVNRSDTEAYWGHLRQAAETSRQAISLAKRKDQGETAAWFMVLAALRDAEVGKLAEARKQASLALTQSSARNFQILAALVLARAGQSEPVQTMCDSLQQRMPLDTLLNGYWLPTIRASVELSGKRPVKALSLLQATSTYELSHPDALAALYPVYVRGEAYLQTGDGQKAAIEFQKVIEHRGIVTNFVLGALAHLQLGRARALSGDKDGARQAYGNFFTLWKDADPDIPILKQAQAEFAKLQ